MQHWASGVFFIYKKTTTKNTFFQLFCFPTDLLLSRIFKEAQVLLKLLQNLKGK